MRLSILLSLVLVIVTAASAQLSRRVDESGKIVSVRKLASDATSFLGSPWMLRCRPALSSTRFRFG